MIKFESEKAFECMLFEHIEENLYDPILMDKVVSGVTQPDFGAFGVGDILLLNERSDFDGLNKSKYLHLIELKVQPLISAHIAQVCRYMAFLKKTGIAQKLCADSVVCTLINPYSDVSPDVLHLAEMSGVGIRFFNMSLNGIGFIEYKPSTAELAKKTVSDLVNRMTKEVK